MHPCSTPQIHQNCHHLPCLPTAFAHPPPHASHTTAPLPQRPWTPTRLHACMGTHAHPMHPALQSTLRARICPVHACQSPPKVATRCPDGSCFGYRTAPRQSMGLQPAVAQQHRLATPLLLLLLLLLLRQQRRRICATGAKHGTQTCCSVARAGASAPAKLTDGGPHFGRER